MSLPSGPPCAACAARERVTYVRDNFVAKVDTTLGLVPVEGDVWACPRCGLRYRRQFEQSTMFHDYDEYYWTHLDLPQPTKTIRVCRCPNCGSTSARADEARSRLEFTYMQCGGCGFGELVDSWRRDFEWFADVEVPASMHRTPERVAPLERPPFGCAQCFGPDAGNAWTSSQARRLSTPAQESHFSVHLTQCACGQRFATVFTERVDWAKGEDDQTWLVVPVSAEEQGRIEAAPPDVEKIARDRRFLLRCFPPGGAPSAAWRARGFAIGPHD